MSTRPTVGFGPSTPPPAGSGIANPSSGDPDRSAIRWLSASEQSTWRSYLLGAARIMEYLDQDLRRHGLDVAEYEILVCLEEVPDRRLRMSELADRVHQSRSRLTHTIARMEKDQFVERLTCPTDRRGVWAHLTDTGYELLSTAAPGHVAAVREIFVDVVDPDDLKAVGRAFEAVLDVSDDLRGRTSSRASA